MKKGLGFLFVALVVLVIVLCVSADGFDEDDQQGLTQGTDLLPHKMLKISGKGGDAEKSTKMNQGGLLEGKFSSSPVLDHGSHGYGIVKNDDDSDDGNDKDDGDDDDDDGEDDDKKAANDHDHDHHHGHDGNSDNDDDEYKHDNGHG